MADGENRARDRPPVDVVIPFAGPLAELDALLHRARRVRLREGDTVTIADNRPAGSPPPTTDPSPVRITPAPGRPSSYYARNEGAKDVEGQWVLFIDADVDPPSDLIDGYFETAPAERTGVLAGGVVDEPLAYTERHTPAARYAALNRRMDQGNTLRGGGEWGYAQTANCAVRRTAFEAVGGFRHDLRSGGDADLCYRLKQAGWEIEERRDAAVIHRSRDTLRKMLRQRVRHGSGVAWLDREYPGSFPARGMPGLAKVTLKSFARAPVLAARGQGDQALSAVVYPLDEWAYRLGRLFPNEVRERA